MIVLNEIYLPRADTLAIDVRQECTRWSSVDSHEAYEMDHISAG
jgi:hypothetical protein